MKVCLACGHRFDTDEWRCPDCGHAPALQNGVMSFAPAAAAAHDGFRADSFGQLAALEAGNFWFRSRNRLICWALRQYFPQARTFLEVGCGTGFVLSGLRQEFPELRLSGSEVFSDGLAIAGARVPGVALFQIDARCIPFEREFDVIGAFDVLEHVEEDQIVLAQLYQATRPGGGIIVTVPQHQWLWSRVDEYAYHKRRYTRRELVTKVVRAGFEVLGVTSFVCSLLPAMLLSRMLQRWSRSGFDPLAEFRIPRFLNALFEQVLMVELRLIAGGISFPAGGSLLVMARRARDKRVPHSV